MAVIFPVALAGLFCVMLLCALYWHWRIYSLYRSLDEVRRKFVYTEFSFQFQSPAIAAWLGGPMFRDGLSREQQCKLLRSAGRCVPQRSCSPFAAPSVFWGWSVDWRGVVARRGERATESLPELSEELLSLTLPQARRALRGPKIR
jgi:hypothetical protein